MFEYEDFIMSEDNKEILDCIGHKLDKKLVIPEGVEVIGQGAFQYNDEVTEIIFPSTLKKIESFAFAGCEKLKKIHFSDLKSNGIIENCAFEGCNVLESAVLPKGLVQLSDFAFNECWELKNVYIPSTVTRIQLSPFSNCESLEKIEISNDNPYYSDMGCGVIFNKNSSTLIQGNTSGVIPKETELIACNAFIGIDLRYKTIDIPANVKTIDGNAFYNSHFSDMKFHYGLRKIYDGALSANQYIETLTLPNSLRYLGDKVFEDCINLKNMRIPSSVGHIGDGIFSNCEKLEEVYCFNANKITNDIFEYCPALKNIYINKPIKDAFDECYIIEYNDKIKQAPLEILLEDNKTIKEINKMYKGNER